MKLTGPRLALGAGAVAAATASGLVVWTLLPGASAPEAPDVVIGSAVDHLPNESATDWVSNADHVVAVRAVDDKEVPPTSVELERGEGVIGRNVELEVTDVVWSSSDAAKAAPAEMTWQAFGWQFKNGDVDQRTPMAVEDAPRLEVGHEYLIAVTWEETCGDDGQTAGWRGLGADSIVPFDEGRIGEGELEGTVRSVAETRTAMESSSAVASLEDKLVGGGVGDIKKELSAAKPERSMRSAASSC